MGFGLYAACGIPKPHSMPNMIGSWLNEIPKDYKPLVLLGVAALCWSVWLCRNVVVFDNKKIPFCRLSTQLRTGSVLGLFFRSILCRTSLQRPLFSWHRWPRFFLPGYMGGGLVLGLTVISVEGYISNSVQAMCHSDRGRENFKTIYHLDVLCLK